MIGRRFRIGVAASAWMLVGCAGRAPAVPEENDAGILDVATDVARHDANDIGIRDGDPESSVDAALAVRTTVDRADDHADVYQMHVLYVEPADRVAAPALDQDGTLRHAVTAFNRWLHARTDGAQFRIDTHQGDIDVTFVKLEVSEAALALGNTLTPTGPRRIHERLEALLTPLFHDPHKMYLVYYDGLSLGTCGDSPLGDHMPMMYIGGVWTTSYLREASASGATSLVIFDPSESQLPAAPFAAQLGSVGNREPVRVERIDGTSAVLAAATTQAHPAGDLLLPDNRPSDCRVNRFSRDGIEFGYATFVQLHEIMHALGIVAHDAPDEAPPPVAAGHLHAGAAGGVNDLMYQGSASGNCGELVARAEDSPCLLDPSHRNYFRLPIGSPLIDLSRSVFLEPSVDAPTLPPRW